jgi:hypothetical protein
MGKEGRHGYFSLEKVLLDMPVIRLDQYSITNGKQNGSSEGTSLFR